MKMEIKNVGSNHGDCFLIEISNDRSKNVILVDGRKGDTISFTSIKNQLIKYEAIDYIVLTHVDNDHINGLLKLFKDKELQPRVKSSIIIYNYVSRAVVSYKQAERFEELIREHTVISTVMRNYTPYASECLRLMSYEMRKELEPDETKSYGVMTFIHPDGQGVKEVYENYSQWKAWDTKYPKKSVANIPANPTKAKLINKNSIAFMIECKGYRVLFTGDGEMSVLIPKIEALKNINDKKIDFIKIAHHGAKQNNKGLVQFAKKHKCSRFLVTGNVIWDGLHPDVTLIDELVAGLSEEGIEDVKIYTNVDISGHVKDASKINRTGIIEIFHDYES